MTGIICADKPQGYTSFDVVARMRGMARTKKIGHAGTLDPMATGVLPLFLNGATRFCDLLPDQDKRYTAVFRLGIVTDTQDITGTVLSENPVAATASRVREELSAFVGRQSQLPPMYSAVKVNGVRLYDLARRGQEVSRPAREIVISDIRLLESDEAAGEYAIDVSCSKGAYIRTLCHDLGQRLGCGATLISLRRTRACGFEIGQCHTMDELQRLTEAGALESALLPLETPFTHLFRLELDREQAECFKNGVRLRLDGSLAVPRTQENCAVFGPDGFLGLARPDLKEERLTHVRVARFD